MGWQQLSTAQLAASNEYETDHYTIDTGRMRALVRSRQVTGAIKDYFKYLWHHWNVDLDDQSLTMIFVLVILNYGGYGISVAMCIERAIRARLGWLAPSPIIC